MDKRTYSQKKRDKMDYRKEYFKHNPGLFGCIWTCAYCHRPLVGKKNVEVDHIMPLNNVLGKNARYNLVAACSRCNKAKSDTVDGRVALGYVSKIFEVIIFTIQKCVIVAFVAIWTVIQKIISLITGLVSKLFFGTSLTVKIIAIACICILLRYFVFTRL